MGSVHEFLRTTSMIREQLDIDLKTAMKAKDALRLATIRSLRAAIMEKEIAMRQGGEATLSEADVLAVIGKQAKQRRDSIEQFTAAGREDLAARESAELDLLSTYLPEQLDAAAIRKEVELIVERTGAAGMKDMGRVMGAAMAELNGRADGKQVQQVVREVLSAL